jgi:hypothetical protein
MEEITQIALIQPEMSWRRNKSATTLISEAHDKYEYREDVHQEILIGEPSSEKNTVILRLVH